MIQTWLSNLLIVIITLFPMLSLFYLYTFNLFFIFLFETDLKSGLFILALGIDTVSREEVSSF